MKFAFVGFVILSAICLSAVNNNGVYAQVTSDNTLGTVVDSNYSITNGIQVGNNLFHSFSQFSIPQVVLYHLTMLLIFKTFLVG